MWRNSEKFTKKGSTNFVGVFKGGSEDLETSFSYLPPIRDRGL